MILSCIPKEIIPRDKLEVVFMLKPSMLDVVFMLKPSMKLQLIYSSCSPNFAKGLNFLLSME